MNLNKTKTQENNIIANLDMDSIVTDLYNMYADLLVENTELYLPDILNIDWDYIDNTLSEELCEKLKAKMRE